MTRARGFSLTAILVFTGCAAAETDASASNALFVKSVVSFHPGEGAGFGQDQLPDIILGPPEGAGARKGSTDVLSLGIGGTITVELGTPVIDGLGTDFIVFENAFYVSNSDVPFAEPGLVEVSADGERFFAFPCEPEHSPEYPGCAGVRPVHGTSKSAPSDLSDPTFAGGDPFDLANLEGASGDALDAIRFVRITDAGLGRANPAHNSGFDLDAIGVVHY